MEDMRDGFEQQQRTDRRKSHRRVLHHRTGHGRGQQPGTGALASNDTIAAEAIRGMAHIALNSINHIRLSQSS